MRYHPLQQEIYQKDLLNTQLTYANYIEKMKKISSENVPNATIDTWIIKLNHNISLPDIVKIFPFTHKAKIITTMDSTLPSLNIRQNKFLLGQVHRNSYNYNLS